jgi:hypothetical protein
VAGINQPRERSIGEEAVLLALNREIVPLLRSLTSEANRVGGNISYVSESPYNVQLVDSIIFCDTDAADIVVNLYSVISGAMLRVVNTGSSGNDVIITPYSTELLVGENAVDYVFDGEVLDLAGDANDDPGGWW